MNAEGSTLGGAEPNVVRLSMAEALGLVRAAGCRPTAPSPLAESDVKPVDPGPEARCALVDAGWLSGAHQPMVTTLGRNLIELLAAPPRRIDLVLGTGTWWYEWTGLGDGFADGVAMTVSHDVDGSSIQFSAPHPPRQPLDLVAAHLRVGHIADAVPLDAELSPTAATTWSGVLDHHLEAQLRSMLDRTPVSPRHFDANDIFDCLMEGRTSSHLAWQTSVDVLVWPDITVPVDLVGVEAGLAELAEQGLVRLDTEGSYELADPSREMIDGLVPVGRWARMTISDRRMESPGELSALTVERLAFRRGVRSMVAERPTTGGEGVVLRSIGDADIEQLLLALISHKADEVAQAPGSAGPRQASALRFCGWCGERLRPAAEFCSACGRAVASQAAS